MSRTRRSVPPGGGRRNISDEAKKRFERGFVPSPVGDANQTFGLEVWTRKAKRKAKRDRAKKLRHEATEEWE